MIEVTPELQREIKWLDQVDLTYSVAFLELLILPIQIVDILLRVFDHFRALKDPKVIIRSPIRVIIGIPINCKLLNLEHLEFTHLQLLVVEIDEGALKTIICGWPIQLIYGQAHIENLAIDPTDSIVFKPHVHTVHSYPQVLSDNYLEAGDEGLLLLFILHPDTLAAFLLYHSLLKLFLLLFLELLKQLLEFFLFEVVEDARHKSRVVGGGHGADNMYVIDVTDYGLGGDLVPRDVDFDLTDVAGLHHDRHSQGREQSLECCFFEYGILFYDDAAPTVDLDVAFGEVLKEVHEGIHEDFLEK